MVRLPLVFFGVTMGSKVKRGAGEGHVASNAPAEARTRRTLLLGALAVSAGLGLVGTAHAEIGEVILLAGWVLLGYAIHRFGRGPGATVRRPAEKAPPDRVIIP